MSGSYGTTSGTGDRAARPLIESLMRFSLDDEIAALRAETPWTEGDRNSRTLAKEVDFRVLLSALRSGATLDEEDGDARASIQLLEGQATLRTGGSDARLVPGELAVVDVGHPWALTAGTDCALLLTLAWPREKAGV